MRVELMDRNTMIFVRVGIINFFFRSWVLELLKKIILLQLKQNSRNFSLMRLSRKQMSSKYSPHFFKR